VTSIQSIVGISSFHPAKIKSNTYIISVLITLMEIATSRGKKGNQYSSDLAA